MSRSLGTVVEVKGAERAIKTGAVQTLVFPYSISAGFLERNQAQSPEEALDALEEVGTAAFKAGLDLSARVAMAFGNPFGDAWSIDEVVDGIDLLADTGVTQITLVDDLGRATPKQIADLFSDVTAVHDELEIGLHLRTRAEDAAEKIRAAYRGGMPAVRERDRRGGNVAVWGGSRGDERRDRGAAGGAARAGGGAGAAAAAGWAGDGERGDREEVWRAGAVRQGTGIRCG